MQAGASFSLLHRVKTSSESQASSYPKGTVGDFSRVWQKRETDHSPSSNAEVKSGGAIPPLRNTST
jgi:hypothetical protein